MDEILRALRPVKGRIRRNRFLRGAAAGLAAGLGTAALLQAVSFFVPVPDRGLWAAAIIAAAILLGACGNALRPVKAGTAAEAADACGLKERAVTALETDESQANAAGQEIIRLQRRDARAALEKLDVKQIRPGSVRKALTAALCCAAALAVLLLVPNTRDREAEADQALRRTLQEGRETVARAAEEDEKSLTEEKRSELRRITEDLRRELDESRDAADALVAMDRAEQKLEQLRRQAAGNGAADAQGMPGAGENAAEGEGEGSGGNASAQAQQGAGSGQNASAASADSGQMKTQQALASLKKAVTPSAGTGTGKSAGAQSAQSSAQSGSQSGSAGNSGGGSSGAGNSGEGNSPGGAGGQGGSGAAQGQGGGGAGEGSTNEEQMGGGSNSGAHAPGTRDPKHKEEAYETIYDPERTERSLRDEMTNQNRLGDDGSVQLETGPGKGRADGDVPWGEALGEYAETEAQAADRENLTTRERQWVTDYFTSLTEQQ